MAIPLLLAVRYAQTRKRITRSEQGRGDVTGLTCVAGLLTMLMLVGSQVVPVGRPFGMHVVRSKARISPNVTRLEVDAPRIAAIRQPGQFVIVRRGEGAERIPLTIADADPARGTITLVIEAVGKNTRELVALEPGQAITDIAGPLGKPTELVDSGRALCVGGGVGTAVVHPIAQGLQKRGVEVVSIIGGRSKEWVIFEAELKALGVIVCTDDGSYGRKGFVTDAARDALAAKPFNVVYAVGPVPMMRAVANVTKPLGVHTIVSLNPVVTRAASSTCERAKAKFSQYQYLTTLPQNPTPYPQPAAQCLMPCT